MANVSRHAAEILVHLRATLQPCEGGGCLVDFPDQPDNWCASCTVLWLTDVLAAKNAEIAVDDKLLEERNRLLDLFECPVHGMGCVPNAMDEVKRLRALGERQETAEPQQEVVAEMVTALEACVALYTSPPRKFDEALTWIGNDDKVRGVVAAATKAGKDWLAAHREGPATAELHVDRRVNEGLYGKFEVRRTDGRDAAGEKHHGCTYFVLDLQHDKHTPAALRAYARGCEAEYPALARDLRSVADDFGSRSEFAGLIAQKPALDLERQRLSAHREGRPPAAEPKHDSRFWDAKGDYLDGPYWGKDCPLGKVQLEFLSIEPKLQFSPYSWKPTDRLFMDVYIDGERYNIQVGDFEAATPSGKRRGFHIVGPIDLCVHKYSTNGVDIYRGERSTRTER